MTSSKITIAELLTLTPHQFAGASKVISQAQVQKSRRSLKSYWADPENRRLHSLRMQEAKKNWTWGGKRKWDRNPNARAVVTPIGSFKSMAEADFRLGTPPGSVLYRISHKWPGYAYEGDPIPSGPHPHNRCYRWVQTPKGKYFTLVVAAKVMGVTTVTVRSRIKRKVPGYAYLSQEDLA